MAGNVILYVPPSFSPRCVLTQNQFYTLSAGFRLRTPMPPYLPPAEEARQRLVEAIRDLDVVKRRSVRGGGRDLLFFAYALAMQVSRRQRQFLGPAEMIIFRKSSLSSNTSAGCSRMLSASSRRVP